MEIFRQVTLDPTGNYEVSNLGNIRSTKTGRILKVYIDRKGYARIRLVKSKMRTNHQVHRLVALAWLDPVPTKTIVNHKNGIRADNRVENLEWVNSKENYTHGKGRLYRKQYIIDTYTAQQWTSAEEFYLALMK